MHITKLTTQNFKGNSAKVALFPLSYITGKNFAGKSSIVEGCQLALMGALPDLGERSIRLLASGTPMSTNVQFNTGAAITRTWKLNANGSVSADASVEGEVDPDEMENIPLLNSAAFFGMTEAEQINFVLRYVPLPANLSAEGIMARLERLAFPDATEEIVSANAEVRKAIAAAIGNATSPVDGVLSVVKEGGYLKSEFTLRNRRAKETIGAVKTLTELKLREAECSAETISELDGELAEKRAAATELAEKIATGLSRFNHAEATAKRRRELETMLATPAKDYTKEIGEWNAKLPDIEAQLSDILLQHPNDDAGLHAKAQELAKALARDNGSLTALKAALVEAKGQREELDKLTACPHCGGKAKGWDKRLRATVEERIKSAENEVKDSTDRLKDLEAKHQAADKLSQERIIARAKQGTLVAARKECHEQIKHLESEQERSASFHGQAKKELETLLTVQEYPSKEQLEVDRASRQKLEAEIAALTQRRDTALKLKHDIQRAAQALLEHQKEAAFVTVIKAAGEVLKDVQREMMEAGFGLLIEDANRIIGDAMEPLVFREGQVGYVLGGVFVNHKTFSGSERALTYIAIAAALSAKSPYRGVILDEFSRLTPSVQSIVAANLLAALKAGKIDQAFVIHPTDAPEAVVVPEGWNHIAL